MDTPKTGRCQCGAVTYSLAAAPLFTYACHCHSCQQRTGSAFSMGLVVLTDSLRVEGELSAWTRTSAQGSRNTRYSCAACGNIIYGVSDGSPGTAKLQPGTLDDTSRVEPEVHIWTQNRQRWFEVPPRMRQFDTQPEDLAALLQAAQAYRAGE